MHTKCYIFRHGEIYDIIIGSSNLTNSALCENLEWNLKFNSNYSGDIISSILSEFEKNFSIATPVDDIWIEECSLIYNDLKTWKRAVSSGMGVPAIPFERIQPIGCKPKLSAISMKSDPKAKIALWSYRLPDPGRRISLLSMPRSHQKSSST